MPDLLTDSEFDKFRKVIYDESGITFSATNRSILDSRLKERLREKKLAAVEDYYKLIMSNRDEMKTMLDSVTTNLTRFFRNQPHFDALIHYIVPHVLENKKKAGDTVVRVWSAGCSTGEEPYTIAMILKDILPAPYTFSITASDISLKSLMVGQQGFYPATRVGGIPEKYLARFFTKNEKGFQVNKDLMGMIHFDYHNLRNDSGARNLDIVFCRNVLIYFDEAAQKAVINRFWDSMGPHSYLFIGHSESLFGMKTQFEFLKTDWACLYQKNVN
ncbi:MAG: protein-glutamate O-methyltransferase CheR [Treponema sp.]|jgi:chemotaxis protein methyltransferase CheR|nr:protein-glutamate O-methyltransferase CheR [Treponema sp.]